jgi:hypothetical protein
MLCHKKSESTSQDDSLQALFGGIDSLGLENTRSYGSWSVGICLSTATNRALDALLKTRPYRMFTPPNRHSTLRVKASLKSVQDDVAQVGDGDGNVRTLLVRVVPFHSLMTEPQSPIRGRLRVLRHASDRGSRRQHSRLPDDRLRPRVLHGLYGIPPRQTRGGHSDDAAETQGGCLLSPRRPLRRGSIDAHLR